MGHINFIHIEVLPLRKLKELKIPQQHLLSFLCFLTVHPSIILVIDQINVQIISL